MSEGYTYRDYRDDCNDYGKIPREPRDETAIDPRDEPVIEEEKEDAESELA